MSTHVPGGTRHGGEETAITAKERAGDHSSGGAASQAVARKLITLRALGQHPPIDIVHAHPFPFPPRSTLFLPLKKRRSLAEPPSHLLRPPLHVAVVSERKVPAPRGKKVFPQGRRCGWWTGGLIRSEKLEPGGLTRLGLFIPAYVLSS